MNMHPNASIVEKASVLSDGSITVESVEMYSEDSVVTDMSTHLDLKIKK